MKTVTYTELDYNELDDMVNGLFPLAKYEFVADEEADNYSSKTYNITMDEASKWDNQQLLDLIFFFTGKYTAFMTFSILKFLVFAGKIPPGDILIDVSW